MFYVFIHTLEALTVLAYLPAVVANFIFFARMTEREGQWASRVFLLATLFHTLWVAARTVSLGYFPFVNWPHCISFIAWAIALGYVYLEMTMKDRRMGFMVSLVVLIFQLITVPSLLGKDHIAGGVSEIATIGFSFHIGASLFACSAFSLSFCMSVLYMMLSHEIRLKRLHVFFRRIPPLDVLERMNYRILLLGFLLLTLGIASGAVIMERGSAISFSTDFKQIPILVLWLLYAANLHTRYMMGWQGPRTAIFSIVNFALVVVFIIVGGFFGPTFHNVEPTLH